MGHGVDAGVGIGIVSTQGSMSINQFNQSSQSLNHSVNQSVSSEVRQVTEGVSTWVGKERGRPGSRRRRRRRDPKERVIESWHGQDKGRADNG